MKAVVIESPFGGDTARNLRYLDLCILDCLDRGETPYASHKMLTTALADADPFERRIGINAGFEFALALSKYLPQNLHEGAVRFYEDLGWSPGMIDAQVCYDREPVDYLIRSLKGTRHEAEMKKLS